MLAVNSGSVRRALRIFTFGCWTWLWLSTQASAQTTTTWSNLGGDGLWSNAANWASGLPSSDPTTALIFSNVNQTAALTLTQDLGNPFILNSLSVVTTSTLGYTFQGNPLQFAGANAVLQLNTSAATSMTVAAPIVIGGSGLTISVTGNNAAAMFVNGTISTTNAGPTTLTLSGAGTSTNNRLNGIVSDGAGGGTIGIFKTGTGIWTLSNPSNDFTGAITVDQGTLRFQSQGSLGLGTTLALGTSNNLTGTLAYVSTAAVTLSQNIVLSGTGVHAISAESTGVLTVAGPIASGDGTPQVLTLGGTGSADNVLAGQLLDTASIGLAKTGTSTWVVTNTGNTFTGGVTITAGSLRADNPATQLNLAGGNNLRFAGAAGTAALLESSGTLTNGLGTGPGQIQFSTSSGGFSAYGGNLDVTFGGTTTTPILWGGAAAGTNLSLTSELQLNSADATDVANIHNSLLLAGSGTHRVFVTDNTASTSDRGELSGTISGSGGLYKYGTGVLAVSGNNAFTGGTTLNAGMLRVADLASNLNLRAGGGNLRFSGTNNGTAGALETSGTLTNSLGTGAGQISWITNGSGGFAAVGGALGVTLNNNATTPLIWATSGFVSSTAELVLSSTSADNVVTVNNAIDLGGLTRSVRVFDNSAVKTDYAVLSGTISNGGLIKQGPGLLVVTGANTFTGGLSIAGGTVRVANTQLNLNASPIRFQAAAAAGAVLETSGTLTNNLGSASGQILWGSINATTGASGGFSAFGGALDVTLNGGDAVTPLVWNSTAGFVAAAGELQFGSVYSDNVVTFNNAVDLNNAVRTIRVNDNPDTNADYTVLSGTLSSNISASGGLIKVGAGTLVLTADSDFTGSTSIRDGALQLGNGGTTGNLAGVIRLTNANNTTGAALIFNHSSIVNFGGTGSLISGNGGGVLITGPATGGVQFNSANTYTQATTVDVGTLRYGIANAVAVGNTLVVNSTGTLDLNGFNGGLTTLSDGAGGGGVVTNNGAAVAVLTLTQGQFTGRITDGASPLALTKLGAGTLTLNGLSNFSGGLTIGGSGVLYVPTESNLGTGPLTFAGGKLLSASALNITNIVNFSGGVPLGGDAPVTLSSGSPINIVAATTLTNASTLGPTGVVIHDDLWLRANLTLTGDQDITLDGNLSLTGGSRTVTVANVGGHTFHDINLSADGVGNTLTLRATTPITVSGLISDAWSGGGLAIASGTVTLLSPENEYSGGTTLSGGVLVTPRYYSLGSGTLRLNGGTWQNDFTQYYSNALSFGGAVTLSGSQSLTLAPVSGLVTVDAATTISNNLGAGLTIRGDVQLNNNLTIAAVSPITISGSLLVAGATRTLTNLANGQTFNGINLAADGSGHQLDLRGTATSALIVNGPVTGDSVSSLRLISGTSIFNATGTYQGPTTIFATTAILGADNVFGTGAVTITGAGVVMSDGAATRTLANPITLSGNATFGGESGLVLSGDIAPTLANRTLTFTGGGDKTISGNLILGDGAAARTLTISGNTGGGVVRITGTVKDGPVAGGSLAFSLTNRVVELSGVNQHTGRTTIAAGAVRLNNGYTNAFGSSSLVFSGTAGNQAVIETSGSLTSNIGTAAGQISWSAGLGGGFAAYGGPLGVTLNNDAVTPLVWNGTAGFLTTGELQLGSSTADDTVTFNNALSTGTAGARTIRVFDGAAAVDAIITGAIVATTTSGSLTKQGAGTLVLTGNNTYTGATTVAAGTLQLGNGSTSGSLLSTQTIQVNAGAILNFNRTASLTQSIIQGPGDVNVSMTGATLSVTSFYLTGNVGVHSGTLQVGGAVATNVAPSSIVVDAGAVLRVLTVTSSLTSAAAISGSGRMIIAPGVSTNAPFIYLGTSTLSGSTMLTGTAPGLQIGDGATVGAGSISGNLNISTSSGTIIFNRPDDYTYSGAVSYTAAAGTAQLRKLGGGVLTLAGNNTYTAATSVAAGTLRVTGALGNTPITVAGGAALEVAAGGVVGNSTATVNVLNNGSVVIGGTMGAGNGFVNANAVLRGMGGTSAGTWTIDGGVIEMGGAVTNTIGTLSLGGLTFTNAGGTINFDLDAPATSSASLAHLQTSIGDRLTIGTVPTFGAPAVFNLTGDANTAAGYYLLMSGYGSTITNTAALTINAPAGFGKQLFSLPGELFLQLTQVSNLVWAGTDTSGGQWDASTASWNGGATVYSDLARDAVLFDDTATGTTSVNILGDGVQPTSVVVNNSALTYTFVGGPITGDTGLSKTGSGLLTLLNDNTFTGALQINGGTVQLGNGGSSGGVAATVPVTFDNGGVLRFNRNDTLTIGGNISGTGSIVTAGSGTLILTGNNSYFGTTTVEGGTLAVRGPGILSDLSPIVINNGTLSLSTTAFQSAPGVTVNAGGNLSLVSGTLAATSLVINGGQVNAAPGSLSVSTFVMTTGTLNADSFSAVLTNVTLGGSTDTSGGANATINVNGGHTLSLLGNLTYSANGNAAADPLGALIQGTGFFSLAGTARTFTVNDSVNADNDLTIAATLTNAPGLTKNGAGTLYLQSANNLTGTVTVSAGVLKIGNAGALGSARLNAAGGTLQSDASPLTLTNVVSLIGNLNLGGTSDMALTGTVINNAGNRTLTISNSGTTTINTLQLSEGATARILTLAGSGNLVVNALNSATVTSGGGLVVAGAGLSLTLNNANNYLGTTSLRDGTVFVGNDSAFGTSTSAIVVSTTNNTGSPTVLTTAPVTIARDFTVLGGTAATITFGGQTAVTSTFAGNITFSQTLNLTAASSGTAVFGGGLLGVTAGAGVNKLGDGTVVLAGNSTYTGTTYVAGGTLKITGTGYFSSNNLVLDNVAYPTVAFAPAGTLVVGSAISGDGNVDFRAGTTVLSASNTFGGFWNLYGGATLQLGGDDAMTNNPWFVMHAGATAAVLDLHGFDQKVGIFSSSDSGAEAGLITNNAAGTTSILTVGLGEIAASIQDGAGAVGFVADGGAFTISLQNDNAYSGGTAITSGTLQIGNGGTTGSILGSVTNSGTLVFNRSNSYAFNGTISGSGAVVQTGSGDLALGGLNNYTGGTTVAHGTLNVTGTLSNSAVTVAAGATLGGTGVIGGSVSSLGTLSPGVSGTGTLTVGSLILNGGALNFDLATVAASDRLILTGSAAPTINAATALNFSTLAGFGPGSYQLISGYSGLISSTGFGLLSSTSTLGGYSVFLQNNAGELDLFVSSGPTTNAVWSGSGPDGTWSNVANWAGASTPISGTTTAVTFGATTGTTTLNQDVAGLQINSLTFTRGDASHLVGSYTVGGQALTFAGSGAVLQFVGAGTSTAVTQTIGVDLLIADGNLKLNSSDAHANALYVAGNIQSTSTADSVLTFAGTSTAANTVAGQISDGAGRLSLVKDGSGLWNLTNPANSFTGDIAVHSGTLQVTAPGALGAAANIYLGSDGNLGTLSYTASAQTLTLSQNLYLTGSGGAIVRAGAGTAPIIVTGNITNSGAGLRQLKLSGANTLFNRLDSLLADGDGTLLLRKEGSGAWQVTNTGNTFTGGVEIVTNQLRVDDMRALNFANNNIRFIGAGANSAHLETAGTLTGNVSATSLGGSFTWLGNGGFSAAGGDLDVTLNGGSQLTWNAGGFVPTGSEFQLNSKTADGVVEFHNAINFNGGVQTIRVRDNGTLTTDYATLSGTLSNGGINKVDGGMLVLTASNSLSGSSTLGGGTIAFGNDRALGTTILNVQGTDAGIQSFGGDRTIANNFVLNSALTVGGSNNLVLTGTISGTGGLAVANSALTLLAGDNTYSGITTITGGTLQLGNGGSQGSIVGDVQNNGTFIFNRANAYTFSGAISGTGSVVQTGTGSLTLAGNSSYSGTTSAAHGTLNVTGTLSNSAVTVAAGATLGGTGVIGGSVSSLGTLSPGVSGTGTLTVGSLILNGGALNFDLGTVAASDRLILTGSAAPTINAATALNFSTLAGYGAGTYTLMAGYSGLIDSTAFSMLSYTSSLGGFGLTVQNNAGELDLLVSNIVGSNTLVWTGATDGAWNTTSANWSGAALTYTNGREVLFDNSSSVNNIAVDPSGVQPVAMTVDADASHNYLFAGGAITSSGVLSKQGVGSLTLANDVSFAGGAIVSDGTLQIGNGGATGSFTGDIVDNGLVAFNRSDAYAYGGAISGIGGLTQNGTGTLVLTGTSSFTGDMTVAAGTLLVQGGNVGSSDAAQLTVGTTSGGSLIINSGGYVTASRGVLASSVGSTGSIVVDGTGSRWNVERHNYVGYSGTGSVTVQNGGTATGYDLFIGQFASSTGTATITGTGSQWTLTSSVYVGNGGVGSLNVLNGGSFQSGPGYIGYSQQHGDVTVSGTGSTWNSATVFLGFANGTQGSLTIQNGGSVTSNNGQIGRVAGATGSALVSGTGSQWNISGGLFVAGSDTNSGGAGSLTVTGGGAVNVAGLTRVWSAGTLTIGSGGTLHTGSLAGNVVDHGSLIIGGTNTSSTYSDVIAGAGGLTKSGTGTLIFTGNNTYAGGTTISGGALQLGNGGATGALTGNVTNSGLLSFNRTGALSYNGIISGNGSVSLSGGSFVFTNNQNYTGVTTINSGATLQLGASGGGGGLQGNIVNQGQLTFSSGPMTYSGTISGNGSVLKLGTAGLVLAGNSTYSGVTTISSGSIQLGTGGTSGSLAGNVVTNSTSTLLFNRSNAYTYGGNISGSGSVRLLGTGTITLAGTSTYTGTTSIAAGTLNVTGTIANSPLTIGSGATLSGTGRIGGATTVNSGGVLTGNLVIAGSVINSGTISPGTSGVGTLTVGSLILGGGSLNFELGTVAASDKIVLSTTNAPVLNLATSLNFTNLSGFGLGTYQLISGYTGQLTSTAFGLLSYTTSLGGFGLTLQNNSGALDLLVSNIAGTNTLVWTGAVSGTWNTTTSNWSGAGTTFTNGRDVVFDTTASQFTVTIAAGGVAPHQMTVINGSTTNYQFYGGAVTSDGALLKQGGGTLRFADDVSFTGGATVEAGTLQIGVGGIAGSFTGDIRSTGTVVFNRSDNLTYSGVISGTGAVRQVGSGTTTFAGVNTYTNVTSVVAGTLLVNGSINSSTVTVASGATFGGGGSQGGAVAVLAGGNLQGSLSIAGAVSSSGTIAPGTGGVGTLHVGSLLLYGGSLNYELGSVGASDQIVVTGTAAPSIFAATNFSLTSLSGYGPGLYHLITGYSGLLSSTSFGYLSTAASLGGYNLTLQNNSGALDLLVGSLSGTTSALWTGAGSNGNWSNAANWSGELPASGVTTTVLFDATTGTTTLNQDLGTPLTLNSLQFVRRAGASYTLSGGDLAFSGTNATILYNGTGVSSSSITQTINSNIVIAGNNLSIVTTSTGYNSLRIAGNITTTNTGATTLTLAASTSATNYVTGSITNGSGTLGLVKADAGVWVLSGTNAFTGGVTVQNGTLRFASAASVGVGSTITLGDGTTSGTISLSVANAPVTLTQSIRLAGITSTAGASIFNDAASTTSTVAMLGAVQITNTGNKSLTLGGANRGTNVVWGTLSNGSAQLGLIKAGVGTWVVTNTANNFSGGVTLLAGILRAPDLAALNTASNAIVLAGTSLTNSGVLETAGTLTLGTGTGAGMVRWTGGGGFSAFGGNLDVTLNNDAATPLIWNGTGGFITSTYNLLLSSTSADAIVNVHNAVDFGGGARVVRVFDNPNSATDYAVLSGTLSNGSIDKEGLGTLVLTNSNGFTGTSTLGGGTLVLGNDHALGTSILRVSTSGTLMADASRTIGNNVMLGGNLVLDGTQSLTLTGLMSVNSGNRTLTVANSAGVTLNNVQMADVGAARTLTVGGNGLLTVQGAMIDGSGSGSLVVNMSSTSTMVMNGNNTYGGTTSVVGGSLLVNGSLASPTVSIAAGASLGGVGSLAGFVTGSGSINPGNGGVGTLSINRLILSGGALNFELGSVVMSDQIALAAGTAPTVNALTNLNFSALAGFGVGTYQLITGYTGLLSTTDFGRLSYTSFLNGYTLQLLNDAGSLDLLVGSVSSSNLVWTGAAGGTWNTTSANWTGSGSVYADGMAVQFGNVSSATTVTVAAGGVHPSSMTVDNDASHNYLFTGGAITSSGTLTKQGVGALILTNDVTFTGGANIVSGTLQIGNGAATGSFTGNIVNNGQVLFKRSNQLVYSGNISGSGGITQTGSGTTIVTGSNTFTGGVTIAAGSLRAADVQNNLNLANNNLVFSGTGAATPVLETSGTLTAGVGTGAGQVRWTGGGGFAAVGGALDVTLNGDASVPYAWGTANYAAVGKELVFGSVNSDAVTTFRNDLNLISADGTIRVVDNPSSSADVTLLTGNVVTSTIPQTLTKTGDGTLVFAGGFSGFTYVNATQGVFQLGNGTAGNDSVNAYITLKGGTLALNQTNDLLLASTMAGTGSIVKYGSNTVTENYLLAAATVTINDGTLASGANYAPVATNLASASSRLLLNPLTATTTMTVASSLSGSGSLVTAGSGTVLYTGNAAHTGGTTVSSGVLSIGIGGASGAVSGVVNLSGTGSLRFNRSDDVTFTGSIRGGGSGAVVKTGGNTLTLSGANTYTNATSVAAGVLRVAGSLGNTPITVGTGAQLQIAAGASTGTGTVQVFNGASLQSEGTSGGNVVINTGGNLFPGLSGIATMTVGGLTLNGGNLYFQFAAPGTNDQIVLTGGAAPTISAAASLNILDAGGFGVGTYTLFSGYGANVLAGADLANLSLNGIAGFNLSLDNSHAGHLDLIVALSSAQSLVWTGTNGPSWNTTDVNWKNGGSPTAYNDAAHDAVRFDDTAGGGEITVAVPVAPDSVVFNNSTSATYTLAGAAVTGTAGLAKNGSGLVVLANDNSYTGVTQVNAGTLQIGGGGTSGSISSSSQIFNKGVVIFNRSDDSSYNGVISGTGSVVKNGAGVLSLGGAQLYTAGTTVNDGVLRITGDGSLPTTGGWVVTGGRIDLAGNLSQTTSAVTLGSQAAATSPGVQIGSGLTLTLGGNVNYVGTTDTGAVISGSGTLHGGAGGRTLSVVDNTNATDDLTISAHLAGANWNKTGAGTLYLAGQNAITGTFTLSSGTLAVGNDSALGTAALRIGGSTTLRGDGVERTLANDISFSNTVMLTIGGTSNLNLLGTISAPSGNSTIIVNNTATTTLSQIVIAGGSANQLLTLGGSGSVVINKIADNATSTAVGSLVLNGSGTVALNGANTYAGGTTIRSGSVLLGNSNALGTSTSAVTVVSATSGPAPQILTNGSVTIARDFNVLSGTGAAATFGGATAVTSTFSGNITFSQAINFSAVAGGTVYFNGTLDDRGASPLGINILGNGTIVLNGANLYTGLTTVSSGTLVANSQLAGQVVVLDGAVFTGSGATVADLNVSGGTSNISDVQSGALNVSAGTVNLASGAAATGGVNVSGGAVIVASGAQIINSDPTNVTGGLLDVNGTVAGIVNVADGGALKGSGTIGGISIGSGGTFAPGNSVGDLTVNGADVGGGATLQVNGGANVVFEFRNAVGNAPGTDWDHVDLGNGLLDLSGASPSNKITLNIDSWKFDNTGHGGGWGDANFNQFRFDQHAVTTYEWLFLETSNIANLVGAAPGTINDYFQIIDDAVDSGVFGTGNPYTRPLDENGQQAHFTLAWKSGLQGTGLYITFTAVPEPGTMVLAGFASLGAGWYGRRRLKRAAK